MDINNKARIHWACRRGMRELDISIMPFFEHEYDTLSDDDKRLFIRLLENDDPDLFNWLMNHGEPADAELQRMVKLIQTRNRLSLVVFDCVRSQRRIHARQGEIKLLIDSRLRWQKAEWDIVGTPWVINSGMLLRLRNTENQRTQHLWVAADSMDAGEWRDLRRLVLQKPTQD